MAKGYVLYNPKAGCGKYAANVDTLQVVYEEELQFLDVAQITNYAAFLGSLDPEDFVILAGGDGTVNRFVNATQGLTIRQTILYYPVGSGNDFAHDLGREAGDQPFPINEYLQDLPSVEVNGQTYRFINGVGYGIDGYCCEVGDELRKQPGKKVNYTMIAIKGLLFHYKPTRATVTVDGVRHTYEKVWLVPTMHGRYYGGGMMPTPAQHRGRNSGKLSTMVFHDSGKLHTLMVFPSLFKGEHIKHTDVVEILEGSEISVEFDRPTALQIDGETILGVTGYTATAVPKRAEALV